MRLWAKISEMKGTDTQEVAVSLQIILEIYWAPAQVLRPSDGSVILVLR